MKLEDFKLKSEAEDSYHLVHPSGKTFTVQKKGLNEKALSKIKKMSCGGMVQKFDGGGSVVDQWNTSAGAAPRTEAVPDYTYQPTAMDQRRDIISDALPAAIDHATPVDPAAVASAANDDFRMGSSIDSTNAPSTQSPASATPDTVSGQDIPIQVNPSQVSTQAPQQQMPDLMGASLDKQEGAVQNYLKQMNGAAGSGQSAQADLIKQLQAQKTPDQIFAENKAKDDQLLQHYMDQKVDPNRYLNNMSTGSKILSAIGIALSGAGAGAHGQNLALEGINKAIDHDISSQESDQSKSMNLLKMNREQTQNQMQAHAMTVNQMITGVQAKIAMATAQSQNAQANLQGQLLIQQLEQQKIMNRQKLAYMQAGPNVDPALLVQNSPMSAAATPAMKEKALGEIEAHQNTVRSRDEILASFDRSAKANHLKDYIPGMANADQKAYHALLGPTFKDVEGTVRQAAMDNMFENTTPMPFRDTSSEIATKRNALIGYMDSKGAAPNFKAVTGMDLNNFASTSSNPAMRLNPQQQRIYQIAMANPGLPQSQLALKKLGVK